MKKKKILYITGTRIPSEKANSIQSMKTCEALSDLYDVYLVYQQRKKVTEYNIKNIYGVKSDMKFIPIYTSDLSFLIFLSDLLWFYSITILYFLKIFISIRFDRFEYIYTRDENLIIFLQFLKKIGILNRKIYFEAHNYKKKYRCLINIDGIVCMTSYIQKKFNNYGITNTCVIHDAVDLDEFHVKNEKSSEYMAKFNLEKNRFIISFIGKAVIYEFEKGIFNIIDSVGKLENNQILFMCVGGPEKMFIKYKKYIEDHKYNKKNFLFIDHVNFPEIPEILGVSDVLISYPPENEVFSFFVSPMKIFEYLAVGKPIILSDLPSHREIIKDSEGVIYVKPENSEELIRAIEDVVGNYDNYRKKALKNIEIAKQYTWKKRAERICNFIEGKNE